MFTGEYRHTVDDKGRIAVPAKFRAQLGAGAVRVALARCLPGHPHPAGWDGLAAKVAALPITDPSARRFQRFIFAGAAEVELDRQGRVLLPAYLREHIELDGEAVVVGSRDHAEIWVPARGRPTPRGSRTPTSWPRPSRARDLARTTCASRVRSGSDRRAVEDRWR